MPLKTVHFKFPVSTKPLMFAQKKNRKHKSKFRFHFCVILFASFSLKNFKTWLLSARNFNSKNLTIHLINLIQPNYPSIFVVPTKRKGHSLCLKGLDKREGRMTGWTCVTRSRRVFIDGKNLWYWVLYVFWSLTEIFDLFLKKFALQKNSTNLPAEILRAKCNFGEPDNFGVWSFGGY
jgi:hypothetical protein